MIVNAAGQNKIETFKREIDSIHVANYAYWNRSSGDPPPQNGDQYELRRDRLNEIKRELLSF
jgi:hypothetical protein